jgi:hypothetical protein
MVLLRATQELSLPDVVSRVHEDFRIRGQQEMFTLPMPRRLADSAWRTPPALSACNWIILIEHSQPD